MSVTAFTEEYENLEESRILQGFRGANAPNSLDRGLTKEVAENVLFR